MRVMPYLLNQFTLKPNVSRERFDTAWAAFIDHLVTEDLARGSTPNYVRHANSGFDTDEGRDHQIMSLISFRDQAQADAAWDAIETRAKPLDRLHVAVFALVHEPVFTFWDDP